MTEEGLNNLKIKLERLETKLSDLLKYKGTEAIFAGDSWHDTPTLYNVEAQERVLMHEISELKHKISNAKIIVIDSSTMKVILGSSVTVRYENRDEEIFQILGEADSDPQCGKISYKSPLGSALLDRHAGETILLKIGGKDHTIEIISIKNEG